MLGSALVVHVRNVQEARNTLAPMRFHLVMTAPDLEDGNWHDIVEVTRALPYHPLVVVVSTTVNDRGSQLQPGTALVSMF